MTLAETASIFSQFIVFQERSGADKDERLSLIEDSCRIPPKSVSAS